MKVAQALEEPHIARQVRFADTPKQTGPEPYLHQWGIQPARSYVFAYMACTFYVDMSSGRLSVLKPAWQLR
jgi:hypothetical protein